MHHSSAPGRTTTSRWRRSRRFNLFSLATLLISAVLIGLVYLELDDEQPSTATGLEGEPFVTFALLDVGQALSAALVTEDGYSMVYDFGLTIANTTNTILPFLDDHGINQINLAITSHPHQDHIGGLPTLLESMPIDLYIDPALETTNQTYLRSLEMIEDLGIQATLARQGDTYSLGAHVELEILWPTDELLLNSDGTHRLNDNSTVVRVDIGDVSILLTGDIEQDAENILVDTMAGHLDVDILLAGHHGSNTSSHEPFLNATSPSVALISAGLNNQYGHPHTEVMQRLRENQIEIYRTDVDGTIIIQTDGSDWTITTSQTGQ
jgi:competence protein ComEC